MRKSTHSRQYAQLLHVLQEARRSAGLTQLEVAKKFGAHASFVSKCESGERRIDVVELAQFCKIYGVTVSDLLTMAGIQ